MQVLNGDGGLRPEVLNQHRVVWFQLFRIAPRDLQNTDEAVPGDQRRAKHRRFPKVLSLASIIAVVIEQSSKPGRWRREREPSGSVDALRAAGHPGQPRR